MHDMPPQIEKEYTRWKEIVGPEVYTCNLCIGIHDVLRAHFLIASFFSEQEEGIGGIGPRDVDLLHSALVRQTVGFGKITKWNSELDIPATLFFGLIKNHPFHDANKRTALLSLFFHLWKLRRVPDTKQKEFETLALRLASNELYKYKEYQKSRYRGADGEVVFISKFLRNKTRRLDRSFRLITYRQLDTLLRRFGFALENPRANYIDIVQIKEKRGLIRKTTTKKRIGNIPFPGWTRQVDVNTLKNVMRCTKLTYENGVDAGAFFQGLDPLPALIDTYHHLLKRLANK